MGFFIFNIMTSKNQQVRTNKKHPDVFEITRYIDAIEFISFQWKSKPTLSYTFIRNQGCFSVICQ